nr:hypothetical protein [uncultured Methylophaga sp.]
MMTKYRWYHIKFPKENFDYLSAISNKNFSEESGHGFMILMDEYGESVFRFIYQTTIQITSIDSEGYQVTENINSVRYTDFSIFKVLNYSFLRIENPGKNLRELLNSIESTIGFGFMANPIYMEKALTPRMFSEFDKFKLVGLKISGAINNDLVTRMEFASKEGIDIDKIRSLEGVNYKISAANYELYQEGLKGNLSYTSSGLVKIGGQLSSKILALFEQDLFMLI